MSPTPRRSSRLRGSYSSPHKPITASSRRLSCLAERDETLNPKVHPDLNATISSPRIPCTPDTVGRNRPPFEKMHPGRAHSTSSPSFDFRHAHPTPALGPDAQRMMDEIREEALRIKVQLAAQREEEKRNEVGDSSTISTGRKIATPKGKISRFSDIHLADFKKMDSIAGHASAFRAQPGRYAAATVSLKRSQSKAKLDSREDVSQGGNTSNQPQPLENTPAKRARMAENQYSGQSINNDLAAAKLSRSQSILSSITTPTQASLARAAGAKKQDQFPTQFQSPSKHSMTAPQRLKKSATMSNIGGMMGFQSIRNPSTSAGKFDRFKSILRRPMIGIPKPAISSQASVPVMSHHSKPNLDKELPSTPSTPVADRSEGITNINVTPRTAIRNTATLLNTPSPMKSSLPRAKSNMLMGDVQYPSLESKTTKNILGQKIDYPTLAPGNSRPESSIQTKAMSSLPSVPGTFTFRSDQTINFSSTPRGFGASPGQSSIRQVRPSIFSSAIPERSSFLDGNKENFGGFRAIPHGLSNKKRRRADSDDEQQEREVGGSPSKRHKGPVTDLGKSSGAKLQPERVSRNSKIPSPNKKGVLSLTRLNMLARPKSRK